MTKIYLHFHHLKNSQVYNQLKSRFYFHQLQIRTLLTEILIISGFDYFASITTTVRSSLCS